MTDIQAGRDAGDRQDGDPTTEERRELVQLRRQNRRLRDAVEILKRAKVCFVEEPR